MQTGSLSNIILYETPKISVLQHFRITDIKQIMGVKGNTADATEIKWSIQYGH